MYVWHFSNGKLANDRNDEIVAGLSLACEQDEIELCLKGFHGSKRLIDALDYAPGNILSWCEVGGCIIEDDDKLVASIRRHVIVVDVERTLHEFAIWCAAQALLLVDEPDPRSLKALEVKRLWLDGKATDEELAAARAAARDTARDAAWDAAWDAAGDAAGAAEKDIQEDMLIELLTRYKD